MSNPFFDAMESGGIAQDIREISELLQQYSTAISDEEFDNINRKQMPKLQKSEAKMVSFLQEFCLVRQILCHCLRKSKHRICTIF